MLDFEAVANMNICSEPAWTHSRRAAKNRHTVRLGVHQWLRNIPVAQGLKNRHPLRPFRILYVLLIVLAHAFTTACAGPGYYLQAASGQWQLMHSREDIDELIESADTDPELVNQLQTANDILAFAETELGLSSGGSYQSYVKTGRLAVTWNVVATPEFSLRPKRWCFPVAGCVPYRGYFEREKAENFAAKLRTRNLDVSVSAATAYSTLGWFEDPLLDTMLSGGVTRLAATLIHELAHRRLYVSGDTPFNEAYAGFVENAGLRAWFRKTDSADTEQTWLLKSAARRDFHQLLSRTRVKLLSLYLSDAQAGEMRQLKADVIVELRSEYAGMKDSRWQGRDYFGGWVSAEINNAHLALVQSYEGGICAFSNLFIEAKEDIIEFHRLAKIRAELERDERRAWLARSCAGIASADDL